MSTSNGDVELLATPHQESETKEPSVGSSNDGLFSASAAADTHTDDEDGRNFQKNTFEPRDVEDLDEDPDVSFGSKLSRGDLSALLLFLFLVTVVGIALVVSVASGAFLNENEAHEEALTGELEHIELPYFDGFFNNPAHPEWGAAETTLLRTAPAAYSDGTYLPAGQDRPLPRVISEALMDGQSGLGSCRNLTAFAVFFGQQVVEEVLDAQRPGCPVEYFNIKIPAGDPQYNPDGTSEIELPFLRSRYNFYTGIRPGVPRMQLNEITSFFDGGLMYGTFKAWSDALRSFQNGELASVTEMINGVPHTFPEVNTIGLPMVNPVVPATHTYLPAERYWKLGNPRGIENPMLLTMGVLWFREHNFQARRIAAAHPEFDDEQIFNEARKWTIATHQHLVYNRWLPAYLSTGPGEAFLNPLPEYTGYHDEVHPGIAEVFQSAAMRYGHTLVTPGVYRRDGQCNFRDTTSTTSATSNGGHPAYRTCNSYLLGQEHIRETGIEELIMGMSSQICEREDNIITEDLRGFVFGPPQNSRRDLMAINMQRARDHGIPDYNTVRVAYGLPAAEFFSDITSDQSIADRINQTYNGDISKVDLWAGGLLESTDNCFRGPGPTFRAILRDQFTRIRDGDRFWYNNTNNGLFTHEEIAELESTTIKDWILRNTEGRIQASEIQDNPFFHLDGDVCPQPAQLAREDMESCSPNGRWDYWNGSTGIIGAVLGSLIFFIAVCCVTMYGRAKGGELARGSARQANLTNMVFPPDPNKANLTDEDRAGSQWFRAIEISSHIRKGLKINSEETVYLRLGMHEVTVYSAPTDSAFKHKKLWAYPLKSMLDLVQPISHEKVDFTEVVVRTSRATSSDAHWVFASVEELDSFKEHLIDFTKAAADRLGIRAVDLNTFLTVVSQRRTRDQRQEDIKTFVDTALKLATRYQDFSAGNVEAEAKLGEESNTTLEDMRRFCDTVVRKVTTTSSIVRLSRSEFCAALESNEREEFVSRLWRMTGLDNDASIDLETFMLLMLRFTTTNLGIRNDALFTLFDQNGDGIVDRDEILTVYASLLRGGSSRVVLDRGQIGELLGDIVQNSDLQADKMEFNRVEFGKLMAGGLLKARVDVMSPRTMRRTVSGRQTEFHSVHRPKQLSKTSRWYRAYVDNRREIFIGTLWYGFQFALFVARFYNYLDLREWRSLRVITGYGVSITRAAASLMMLTFAALLLTMSKNVITALRDSPLGKFVPFDKAFEAHRHVAYNALLWVVMHLVGHSFNFYNIVTQPVSDLSCTFREVYHFSDEIPRMDYWVFETVTGLSGYLVTLVVIIMYTFAQPYARNYARSWFWATHQLYIALYGLMLLHGSYALVQYPEFQWYIFFPVLVYTFDKLWTLSRSGRLLETQGQVLPAGVLFLKIERPDNFEYHAGQYVRVQCPVINNSFHPFTITSAPHEKHLSVHIRALGPWTTKLRTLYAEATREKKMFPRVRIHGPFGEGHQDWLNHRTIVLVGGGIGVTPFASILKDLAHRVKIRATKRVQKIYFLWSTRDQSQFQWLVDVIADVEETCREHGTENIFESHIYITGQPKKFELRTSMLYSLETSFQAKFGKSLATGLQAVTHFGRPDFKNIIRYIKANSQYNVGVFTCAGLGLVASARDACDEANREAGPRVFHYFQNF